MSLIRNAPALEVPVPGLRQAIGVGQAVKAATSAVGIKPCTPCEQRARFLDRLLAFRPLRGRQ